MGNITGLQRHIFPHSHNSPVKEIPKVLFELPDILILSPSLWPGYSSVVVHQSGKGSETHGTDKGYLYPPVPR